MRKITCYIIILISVLTGCKLFNEKGEPVAKVGNKTLTMKELSKSVPNYLDATDSALWADDYIKKWVQRELLLLKAEEALSSEMKNVTQELDEYRNSLIVYRYKNEVIKQKIDTIVKDSKIQQYFNEHRESFILNKNIVKAIYIKVPVELSSPENLKELCASNIPDKIAKLNEFCLSYAKAYDRFNDQWVSADLVLKNTPEQIADQSSFLQKNRFIESSDRIYYYIVYIRDYRLAGDISPIEYVQSDIRNLILSKQKIDFLKQIEKDIYKEGIENKKVKFYKIKK